MSPPDVPVTAATINAKAREANLTLSTAAEASVFVVKEVQQPSKSVLWNVALIGGTICTWDRVMTSTGPTIVYKAMLSSQKIVYMSDAFLAECPRISALMVALAGSHPGCKWKFTNDLEFDDQSWQDACNGHRTIGFGGVWRRGVPWRQASIRRSRNA